MTLVEDRPGRIDLDKFGEDGKQKVEPCEKPKTLADYLHEMIKLAKNAQKEQDQAKKKALLEANKLALMILHSPLEQRGEVINEFKLFLPDQQG